MHTKHIIQLLAEEKEESKQETTSKKIIKYGKVQEMTHTHSLCGLSDQAHIHIVEVKFSAS